MKAAFIRASILAVATAAMAVPAMASIRLSALPTVAATWPIQVDQPVWLDLFLTVDALPLLDEALADGTQHRQFKLPNIGRWTFNAQVPDYSWLDGPVYGGTSESFGAPPIVVDAYLASDGSSALVLYWDDHQDGFGHHSPDIDQKLSLTLKSQTASLFTERLDQSVFTRFSTGSAVMFQEHTLCTLFEGCSSGYSTDRFKLLAVPEPETWALLMSGVMVTGGVVARRRSRARQADRSAATASSLSNGPSTSTAG